MRLDIVLLEGDLTVKRLKFHAVIAAIILALSPMAAMAEDAPASSATFTEDQKKALDSMMHDYMMNNPQVIMDSVEKFRQNQEAAEGQALNDKIKEKGEAIYRDPNSPVAGNKDGDVTLVEFFDYNCGYCKQAYKDIEKLVEEDKKLRVVFKEIPILSETSHMAARYALAANKQGKYWEFHSAMMNQTGPITEEKLESVGKDVGLDVKQLKTDADSAEVRSTIEKDLTLARELGISGTPAFIIDGTALRGHFGLEALKKTIADAREKSTKGKD